jgi:hypothetical protein
MHAGLFQQHEDGLVRQFALAKTGGQACGTHVVMCERGPSAVKRTRTAFCTPSPVTI